MDYVKIHLYCGTEYCSRSIFDGNEFILFTKHIVYFGHTTSNFGIQNYRGRHIKIRVPDELDLDYVDLKTIVRLIDEDDIPLTYLFAPNKMANFIQAIVHVHSGLLPRVFTSIIKNCPMKSMNYALDTISMIQKYQMHHLRYLEKVNFYFLVNNEELIISDLQREWCSRFHFLHSNSNDSKEVMLIYSLFCNLVNEPSREDQETIWKYTMDQLHDYHSRYYTGNGVMCWSKWTIPIRSVSDPPSEKEEGGKSHGIEFIFRLENDTITPFGVYVKSEFAISVYNEEKKELEWDHSYEYASDLMVVIDDFFGFSFYNNEEFCNAFFKATHHSR